MRSGSIEMGGYYVGSSFKDSAYLRHAGREDNYWATTATSSANATYDLLFSPTGVAPSRNDYRYNGFSLRCLPCIRMAIVVAAEENKRSLFSLPTATPIQQE